MTRTIKSLLVWIPLIALILIGVYLYGVSRQIEQKEQSQVTMVLEQVKNVMKLVVVEGQVAEIFDKKYSYYWDNPIFSKKILVRVHANVSVGYDLESLSIISDEASKTVSLGPIPEPQILSIDHQLDYYDITEGLFNTFSADDLTQVNKEAKEYIRKKILSSNLLDQAVQQKNDVFQVMQDMLESIGWKLEIRQNRSPFDN